MYRSVTLVIIVAISSVCGDMNVVITGDASVVLGGTLSFKADVFESFAGDGISCLWFDDAYPRHVEWVNTTGSSCHWNVSYDPAIYPPGQYFIEVKVYKDRIWPWSNECGKKIIEVNVTALVGGDVSILQNNATRQQYLSTNGSALYNVSLVPGDAKYIHESRPQVFTYWFLDCEYYGVEAGYSKTFNFNKSEETHFVEVLLVASAPPPAPPTTTTTTTTTSTTTPSTTTSTTTTTTTAATTTTTAATTTTTTTTSTTTPKTTTIATNSGVSLTSSTAAPDPLELWLSQFPQNRTGRSTASNYCINISSIPMAPSVSSYGYFRSKIITKGPVSSVQVNGSNWLKEGDFLKMSLSCNGSGPFTYCVQLTDSSYNVTGRERCDANKTNTVTDCLLAFGHLFPHPKEYKLLFIISNMINTLVTPVGVNVYQVTKQPQISVIVVPVVSSIVAVVLIVFGIASYIHSRRTYVIEVADFDFGQQSSDELEYKTFTERLRESILNSFFRTGESDEETEGAWSPSRPYGSMQ